MRFLARCIAVLAALQYALAAELTFKPEKLASSGQLTLEIGEVDFGNGYPNVITRGFDGGVPGPTFRMQPGETLSITLTNNLNSAHSKSCDEVTGEFCETSISNLHTHGLHVSPNGIEDGLIAHSDNIFAALNPGETANFSYAIPEYHMGGTHWYHPHHHHATALQAGGGAAGALIVEDPDGYLPTEYASMIEKILFISGHNLNTLQQMALSSESVLLTTAFTDATNANLDTNVFLTNGQMDADMSINSHQWYRFRMIYAAVEQSLQLSINAGDNGAVCEWKLLAKDGIYLNTIPRDIGAVMMFPGARADVAVSCTCTTYPCTATLGSAPAAARRSGSSRDLMQGPGPGGGAGGAGPGGAAADAAATVTVLSLIISETVGGSTITLPTTNLQRPCYLVNLQDVVSPPTGALDLNGGQRKVTWDGFGASMTYSNSHPANGLFTNSTGGQQDTWPAIATFTAGTVQEFKVTGANAHPLHIHVNPFQITEMPATSYNDEYFQVGDWHDTLMISDMGGNSELTVRSQLDVFTGKTVVHCHILEHEDEGMMSWFLIEGTFGDTYTAAKTIDSTCYDTAFTNQNQETPSSEPTGVPTSAGLSSTPSTTSSEPTGVPTSAGLSSTPSTTSSEPTGVPTSAGSTCAETKAAYKSSSCCNQANTTFANYSQCVNYKATYQSSDCCRRRRQSPQP